MVLLVGLDGGNDLVLAIAVKVGLDDSREESIKRGAIETAGGIGPGDLSGAVEGSDYTVVESVVMERRGAKQEPGEDCPSGEGREDVKNGIRVRSGGRERGISVTPLFDLFGDGEDETTAARQAVDRKSAFPFPELDRADGDTEVVGEFFPGLELGRRRCH